MLALDEHALGHLVGPLVTPLGGLGGELRFEGLPARRQRARRTSPTECRRRPTRRHGKHVPADRDVEAISGPLADEALKASSQLELRLVLVGQLRHLRPVDVDGRPKWIEPEDGGHITRSQMATPFGEPRLSVIHVVCSSAPVGWRRLRLVSSPWRSGSSQTPGRPSPPLKPTAKSRPSRSSGMGSARSSCGVALLSVACGLHAAADQHPQRVPIDQPVVVRPDQRRCREVQGAGLGLQDAAGDALHSDACVLHLLPPLSPVLGRVQASALAPETIVPFLGVDLGHRAALVMLLETHQLRRQVVEQIAGDDQLGLAAVAANDVLLADHDVRRA